MTSVWYATDVQVKRALDASGFDLDDSIKRALESASRSIDGDRPTGKGSIGRRFYPELATHTFTGGKLADPLYRLQLGRYDLISATTVTSAGVAISASDYTLKPNDGPPYDQIDLKATATVQAWSSVRDGVSIVGLWGAAGGSADEQVNGTIKAALADTTGTAVQIGNSAEVGAGTILRVDSERLIVTARADLTTGQALVTPLAASVADQSVVVSDGTQFAVGETITLNNESMFITRITGNTLIVKRMWDGTTLATHTGSTIYAPRLLTVARGALGTTAATHLINAPLFRHVVPPMINALCVGEAVNQLEQEGAAYGRASAGEGGSVVIGAGLADLREQAKQAYRRRVTWLGV